MPEFLAAIAKYAPTIIGGLDSVKGLFNKPPKHNASPWEKKWVEYTSRAAKEGAYTPAMQKEMITGVSQATGDIAEQQRGKATGRAIASGLENSIAGFAGMDKINQNQMTQIANTARQIAIQNAQSKITAQNQLGQYGQMVTNRNYADALNKYQNTGLNAVDFGGLGGMLGNVSNLFTGKDGQNKLIQMLQSVNNDTPMEVITMLQQIAKQNGWIK